MRRFTEANATPMTAEEIAAHWNINTQRFAHPHARLRVIADLVDDLLSKPRPLSRGPAALLDVGCGPGTLRTLIRADIAYHGADIAAEAVPDGADPARWMTLDLNTGAEPFPGQTFDVVVVSGTFEYIRDPVAFLALMSRKVRQGGHLILTYMNRSHHREVRARLRRRAFAYPDPHLNFISIPTAARLMRGAGFVIERTCMLTQGLRVLPTVPGSLYFPFNVLARQFLFVCVRPYSDDPPR